MAAPISTDLRTRVIAAYEAKEGGYGTLGERFDIDPSTVRRWVKRKKKTGNVDPIVARGSVPLLISADELPKILKMVEEKSDLTADELVTGWREKSGASVSRSTMVRALKRLGLSFKKKASDPPSKIVRTSRNGAKSFE